MKYIILIRYQLNCPIIMDFITTYILTSIPYIFSSISIGISLYVLIKKRKSDQFHIALEINDRLEKNAERNTEIHQNLKDNPDKKDLLELLKRDNEIGCLNILEFFSLLINNKEIENSEIIEHFKPTIVQESKRIFNEYSDIRNNTKYLKQLRKLLDDFEKC